VPPSPTFPIDQIDLSDLAFWERPLMEREAAFAALRAEPQLRFFAEPDVSAAGLETGPGYWAVTHLDDILEISRRPESFCSSKGATSIPDMPDFMLEYFGSMINLDDPRHARLRKIVAAAFTPKMLKRIEDDVQRIASEIVAEVRASGGGDFVTDVAAKLPLRVICDMMGIPASEYDTVFTRSNIIIGNGDAEYVSHQDDPNVIIAALLTAGSDLHTLVSELGKARRENPTDDLTSALVNASVDGESITDAELGSFFILLVVAGNETTRNAIAHGLNLLSENPDQRAIWAADFEAVAPTAVEEIVRVASPVVWMRRTATHNTTLRNTEIAAGDKFLLYYWSANRDEATFVDPYKFDVRRSPNPHVGFGGPGPHFCLGAHLARREVTVMFRELFANLPTIQVTGPPDRLRSAFINGIKHLPFTIEG
jgi:methyl-branched lipid omega-hydroxylase